MWCSQIVSALNLFTHNNNTYFLINDVFFKVLSSELHSVSPAIASPFKAFCDVHCLKLGKCILQFCLFPFNNILISSPVIIFERNSGSLSSLSQKTWHMLTQFPNMLATLCTLILLFLRTRSFTGSTFLSLLILDG